MVHLLVLNLAQVVRSTKRSPDYELVFSETSKGLDAAIEGMAYIRRTV